MESRHEEIARCLFRESNDALFLFDPADHRVVDLNPAAQRLTGLDKGVACSLRLHDLFAGSDPGGIERLIDAYRRTGFHRPREGYSLRRSSAEPIPVNISVSRIHTEPDPLGLVVARDISDRVQAQGALRESEARYRGLVEAARVLIWSASAEWKVRSLNPAFEAIVGPEGEHAGRPLADLVHPDDVPLLEDLLGRALRNEPGPSVELRLRPRSDGADPPVIEVLSAARQVHGGQAFVSGIARDVTERRRAEEATRRAEALRIAKEAAEAADRAKSEFLGNVSHELRTPLTAILGFADVLLEDERIRALPADLIEALRTIARNGNHLLDLINDILDLTRIEAGKLRFEPGPCRPAPLAEEVAAALRPRAESKGLTLAVEVEPDAPALIRTDAVRLRQVLINLVGNAVKFTHAGAVRLRVERVKGDDEAPSVRFAIIDTGVGLSETALSRLFEPFYTAEARPTTRESGAGLGLPISRKLAELLDGRIVVRSRAGVGSTFALTLPIGMDETAEPAPSPAPAPSTPQASPTLTGRILLAEDNEPIRHFLGLRLRHAGAEVDEAPNGLEAVRMALRSVAEGRPYDWVLMDVQMPVLDGYEATSQLRDRGYRRPILALTAYAIAENREECLRFGCDDHIAKPIDWPNLLEVLEAHRPSAAGLSASSRSRA